MSAVRGDLNTQVQLRVKSGVCMIGKLHVSTTGFSSARLKGEQLPTSSFHLSLVPVVTMSGFETVAAAFGVIHLAKLTVNGLYQLLRDYKDAGNRLFEIVEDFDCFQWRLDLWSRTWHIGQTSPESEEAHVKALWSDTGARFIVVQLASIDEGCRRFTRLMAKLMGDEHLKEQNLQNQLLESRIIELPQNAKVM